MRSSVDFWYFLISRRQTVPGRNLCGFLTDLLNSEGLIPPDAGAVFLITPADFAAKAFLGAFDPVTFLAVYLVLAITVKH